jgi:predicted dehydrogenase
MQAPVCVGSGKFFVKKVLLIGGGGIARRHILGFQKTGRAKVALVEPVAPRRAALASEFGLSETFGDLAEVDLAEFDLAVICSPADTHVAIMHTCIDAGLPFLVEKPLAVSNKGIADLRQRLRDSGLAARVGFARRNGPEILDLRQQIIDGRIGDLRLANINVAQEYLRYRPDLRETFFVNAAKGGGAVLDIASHLLDILIWIMGPVAEVGAITANLGIDRIEVEDTCLINLRFVSGALGNISINLFQKPNASRWEFVGREGNLTLDHSKLMRAVDDSGAFQQQQDFMAGLAPQEAHQARFERQAILMLDHLDGAPCHLCTVNEAAHVLEVALAAKQSWRERRIIAL